MDAALQEQQTCICFISSGDTDLARSFSWYAFVYSLQVCLLRCQINCSLLRHQWNKPRQPIELCSILLPHCHTADSCAYTPSPLPVSLYVCPPPSPSPLPVSLYVCPAPSPSPLPVSLYVCPGPCLCPSLYVLHLRMKGISPPCPLVFFKGLERPVLSEPLAYAKPIQWLYEVHYLLILWKQNGTWKWSSSQWQAWFTIPRSNTNDITALFVHLLKDKWSTINAQLPQMLHL